jgi:hypothetical protein
VCFQPLKHYYAEAIDALIRAGGLTFFRTEFLATFHTVRTQAFKESTILLVFRETGLIPYNPGIVLRKIPDPVTDSETTIDSSDTESILLYTPQKPRHIQKVADYLQEELKALPEQVYQTTQKFIKGALINAHARAHAEEEFANTQVAEQARAARAKATRRHIQKGGVVKVSVARNRINLRTQREELRKPMLTKATMRRQRKVFEECAQQAQLRSQLRSSTL